MSSFTKSKSLQVLMLSLLCCALSRNDSSLNYAQETVQETVENPSATGYRITKIVTGRLTIPPITHALKLAEANEVPLQLHGHAVHSANASLEYYNKDGRQGPIKWTSDVTVMYRSDGSAYIVITPEEVGKVEVIVSMDFEDGAFDSERIDASVVFPDSKPDAFYVRQSGSDGPSALWTIYMDLSDLHKYEWIVPAVRYAGVSHSIQIPANSVTFKLIYNRGESPIALDESTGAIVAQRLGHVIIESSFEGLTYLSCVAVQEYADDGSARTNCSELVPSGMKPPPETSSFTTPGPTVKPRKK